MRKEQFEEFLRLERAINMSQNDVNRDRLIANRRKLVKEIYYGQPKAN